MSPLPFDYLFSCLVIVAVGKIFEAPFTHYMGCDTFDFLFAFVPLCLLLLAVVLVLFIILLVKKLWRSAALSLLSFLLALLLPLGFFYETSRFVLLLPLREYVATEIAKSYQDNDSSDVVGYIDAETEYPSWFLFFLARGGHVHCERDRKNTRVYFMRYDNGISRIYDVFITDVPYTGTESASSSGYNFSIPRQGDGPLTKPLFGHWITYVDPYAEIL